jgi:hypothetical protein
MTDLKNELNVTLGVLAVNLARVVLVADGVAEFVDGNYKKLDCVLRQVEVGVAFVAPVQDVPTPPVAPVAAVPLDVAHTLAMHEMRMILTTEQSQMRVYMRNLAIAMALVVFVMSIVVMIAVYAIVYRLKEPAVCESFPSVLPTMYDNMKCCARMFSEDSS